MRFVRIALLWLVAVAATHWILRIYLRSLKREALENAWDRGEAGAGQTRDAYVEAGMADYDRSLLFKLLMIVYVLPLIVIGVIIYFVNFT